MLVGVLISDEARADGLRKVGSAANCWARDGVVTIEIPRPWMKVESV